MHKIKLDKHIKIKLIISIVLIGLLILSFFFASSIESFLGLAVKIKKNQILDDDIDKGNYFVSYLDVGQGNSTFIQLPDDKTILIDGGDIAYGEGIGKFLNSKGVDVIDYLIATHSDADHIGGLGYVLDNFEVKNIYRPFQIAGTGTSAETFEVYEYDELGEIYDKLNQDTSGKAKMSRVTSSVYKNFIFKAYNEKYLVENELVQSEITVFFDGLTIIGENYKLEFFGPLKRDIEYDLEDYCDRTKGFATKGYGVSETNENSAIFLFSCYDDHYLFTGDASFNTAESGANKSEDDFIESLTAEEIEIMKQVDVFMLGHHGSKYSSSSQLLNLIIPRFVVISSGNMYGHPAQETLDRVNKLESLEEDGIVRTDTSGTVSFTNISGELKYSLELDDANKDLMISYYELGSIVIILVIFIIFSIKPRRVKA